MNHHNPLKRLGPQAISHLKPEHIDYVMQWTAFLQLENSVENTRDNFIAKTSDIWTLPVDERLALKITCVYIAIFLNVNAFSVRNVDNALLI